MRKLIWVDDRADEMEQILRGAFYDFWDRYVFNQIVFFGDAFGEITGHDVERFDSKLKAVFSQYLKSRRIWTDDESNSDEVKDFISQVSNSVCVSSIRNSTHADHIDKWKKLDMETWRDSSKSMHDIYIPSYLDELIQNDNGDQIVFALDLVLLEGDLEKLDCDQSLARPILSMEIYHYIKKTLRKECVLYSRYTFRDRFQNNWKHVYSLRYPKESIPEPIIPRVDFHRGAVDMREIERVMRYFSEEGKR